MPRGATGHARIQTLSLAGNTKVKIQSQESDSAGKGRGKREQAFCGAHVASSLSSDSGIFPHVLYGEFCNQILLREAHFGRSRVDSSRGPVLMLSSTKSSSGEVHIWSSFYFLQRQKTFSLSHSEVLTAGSVGSAAAGLEAEEEAEVENWTQQEFRVQNHLVAEDDRKAGKASCLSLQVMWQDGLVLVFSLQPWQHHCRDSACTGTQ